jgi:hypothetical protein
VGPFATPGEDSGAGGATSRIHGRSPDKTIDEDNRLSHFARQCVEGDSHPVGVPGTSTTNGFTIQRDGFVLREKAPRKILSFAATYSESR